MTFEAPGGPQIPFCIVSDFDHTMTTADSDTSCMAILRQLGQDSAFARQRTRLFERYRVYLQDSFAPADRRDAALSRWWRDQLALYRRLGVRQKDLACCVRRQNFRLRDGWKELLCACAAQDIPVFVLSAGLGDVVRLALKQCGVDTSALHLYANFLTYRRGGVHGYRREILHPYNKAEHLRRHPAYWAAAQRSRRILVFGDRPPDACVADDFASKVVRVAYWKDDRDKAALLACNDYLLSGDMSLGDLPFWPSMRTPQK